MVCDAIVTPVPADAAETVPEPFAERTPLTAPAPPYAAGITVPFQAPVVTVPVLSTTHLSTVAT